MEDRSLTYGRIVVVALTVVALTVVSGYPVGGQETAGTPTPTPRPTTATCDYAQLYNESVGSVVLVRHEGGQGSGFVYDRNERGVGYVVTNHHVVGDAGRVEVGFNRGEARVGRVIGTAEAADLAVIRVNRTPAYATELPVNETTPVQGQEVAALGTPLGLRSTITHGIVSGTDRSVPTERGFSIPDVVQTDAPINPGNSGGPLVTCDGDVVGVNTAGIPAARAENIGFAVSANLVDRVVPALVETGEFAFPYLGVRHTNLDPVIVEAANLETTQGVMVVETVPGSPADGVLEGVDRIVGGDDRRIPIGGDVIVAVAGQPIHSAEDLSSYLATDAAPGERVNVTVVRDGERTNETVTLSERPDPSTA